MYANSVNQNTANRVSSRMPSIPTVSSLVGFFLGYSQMKTIELTKNMVALVEDRDFEWLNQWKWFTDKRRSTFYAARKTRKPNGQWTTTRMHRVIMQAQKGQQIDHRNGNGLDNRRFNLRFCTHTQNQQNREPQKSRSRYKGVCWHKRNKKWQAQIKGNKKHYLGCFDNEIKAAEAYNRKASELFGEFANLNIINERVF